jgi:hypothetical protein
MLVTCERAVPPRAAWIVQSVLVIAALPSATPRARLHARTIAREWGLGELADTIELVVSELVTNSIKASLENSGLPEPTQASLDDESGRGLMLVDTLAERWGWDLPGSGRGKVVWALIVTSRRAR